MKLYFSNNPLAATLFELEWDVIFCKLRFSNPYTNKNIKVYCLLYEILKEKGEIYNSNGDKVLYLNGDFNSLEDLDYFGIVGQFIELFSWYISIWCCN